MDKLQSIFGVLQAILALLAELPNSGAIAAIVWSFVKSGDWAGLLAYLESLLQPTPPPQIAAHASALSPKHKTMIKDIADNLKATIN